MRLRNSRLTLERRSRRAFATTLSTLAIALVAWAHVPASAERPAAIPSPPTDDDRIREGTHLTDTPGSFLRSAGRLTFQTLDDRRFIALENLALERISQQIQDDPEPLEWSVSGTVTEFRAANYLLVERAVLRARTDRRASPSGRQF